MPTKVRKAIESEKLKEEHRAHLKFLALDSKVGMGHKQAERVFREFQRACPWNDTVTGWSGVWTL